MFADADAVAIGDYRTKMGISRKFAQYFLDYFDSQKISKLTGEFQPTSQGADYSNWYASRAAG